MLTATVVANVLAYAFHFVAGRMLGPESYGTMGALIALFSIVTIPLSSFAGAVTRFASIYSSREEPGAIYSLRNKVQQHVFIIAAILLLLLLIFVRPISDYFKLDNVYSVFVVGAMVLFNALYILNSSTLLGLKHYNSYSMTMIAEALIRLALLYILLFSLPGYIGGLVAYGTSYLICYFGIFLFLKTDINKERGSVPVNVQDIYRFAFSSMVLSVAFQALINTPTIFINQHYSKEFTGYWTAAINIARITLFVSGAIVQVLFAELSASVDQIKRNRIIRQGAFLVIFAHVLMAVVIYILPEFAIKLIYGSQYLAAAPLLKALGVIMIPVGMLQLGITVYLTKEQSLYRYN